MEIGLPQRLEFPWYVFFLTPSPRDPIAGPDLRMVSVESTYDLRFVHPKPWFSVYCHGNTNGLPNMYTKKEIDADEDDRQGRPPDRRQAHLCVHERRSGQSHEDGSDSSSRDWRRTKRGTPENILVGDIAPRTVSVVRHVHEQPPGHRELESHFFLNRSYIKSGGF